MIRFTAAAIAALLALCVPAVAQQIPCTGCVIANAEAAAQVRANQAIVQSTLQSALNAQLQTQASTLQTQALLRSLQQANAASAGVQELQQLLILQQLELLQIQERSAAAAKRRPAKPASSRP